MAELTPAILRHIEKRFGVQYHARLFHTFPINQLASTTDFVFGIFDIFTLGDSTIVGNYEWNMAVQIKNFTKNYFNKDIEVLVMNPALSLGDWLVCSMTMDWYGTEIYYTQGAFRS
jgi:hypothetical protein